MSSLNLPHPPSKKVKCELCTSCEWMQYPDGGSSDNLCIFGGPYIGHQDKTGKPLTDCSILMISGANL